MRSLFPVGWLIIIIGIGILGLWTHHVGVARFSHPQNLIRQEALTMIVDQHVTNLALSPQTAAKFKVVLLTSMKQRQKLLKQKQQLLQWLSNPSNLSTLNPREAQQKLKQLRAVRESLHKNCEEEFESLQKHLSPKELLQFYVYRRKLTHILMAH